MTQNSARSRSDVVSQRDVIHIRRINSPDQTFLKGFSKRQAKIFDFSASDWWT
jgi:hypothetical protein